ncbi:apoptotic protease-activating factor 1-like [Rhopilema esculentum]|uniref:apoptotic protease-activating factor 1-like n=1 Tax=Rhopilema esculentum TaxID=499914 RepID=UPI0031D61A51
MNEQQRFLLISNKKNIGDDLRPEDVFSYLQSKIVLDLDEVELVKTEKTSRRRTERLLNTLLDKGSSAFVYFHDALIDAGYEHLAELLSSGIDENDAVPGSDDEEEGYFSVEAILRDGGVPQRPAVHAKRPKEIEKLKNALSKLKNGDGWVLLHGMAGSGKTVLASEVLTDKDLLHDCFPGGVFWVSIGVVDAARLLMKMQNLCARLDSENTHRVPRNLEEARDRIRILFAHDHPRSLLVLDDLWTKEDARYFDVRARTLATSRNVFVAENITGNVLKVHIEEGLTDDQSKSVLSQWVHSDASTLPVEAAGLINACQGSPLAISMIGALLKAHSNRWEYYLKQLQDHKVSKLKSKLAYEYPTLCDAIAISVSSLPDKVKRKYEYFAIFEEDSRIPAKVLGLLWGEDVSNCFVFIVY